MSYFLINLENEFDFENFKIENLIIDSCIDSDSDNKKYLLYYIDDTIPKEIYIKLPKIRLISDWTHIKYNQLKIRITPKYDKTDRIIKFINLLEETIKSNKKFVKKTKLEFISLLIKEETYYFKTFFQENKTKISSNLYNENIKIISNLNNENIKITDFKNNGEIQMVLKINNIWHKNNKYGLSSQLYQIKYFVPPEILNIDFIDDEVPIKQVVTQPINIPINKQPLLLTQAPITKPMLMINSELLQSVKLKSIKK